MAQQVINIGTTANDGTGDGLRTSFDKCNDNFGELYSRYQDTIPTAGIGKVGDTAGMYAMDASFFYYCFQNYDGSSVIWRKIAGSAI